MSDMSLNKLAPDRFLPACPINYECPHLFMYLVEMEFVEQTDAPQTILKYPETRDNRFFKSDAHMKDFEANIQKFAYPFNKTIKEARKTKTCAIPHVSSSLVQFYTFVFTDENRIRQYGFCRSAQGGKHVICLVSYLPWHNVLILLLNKVATIINERDTTSLYHFLEAIYEYELPKPGQFAEIFSHDGTDSFCFNCPDRRIVPSINENRNLLKFFAFFDLDKIIQIFTALLLERHILIVSKDLENLTSCALSLEYLIHPLEWFHAFAPIMPEHIDIYVFNQPFPFIYGIHPCVYEKLNQTQLDDCVILKVDERQIINGDKDQLPENVTEHLRRKLKFFQETGGENPNFIDYQSTTSQNLATLSHHKYDRLLRTGTVQAFLDSVLMIIDDYRQYLKLDPEKNEYALNEDIYFQMKNVQTSGSNGQKQSKKYFNGENEFYHEFRVTQAFEEFCRDRCDYLKAEEEFNNSIHMTNVSMTNPDNFGQQKQFQKDFIETLFEQYNFDHSKLNQILKSSKKKIDAFRNKAKKAFHQAAGSNTPTALNSMYNANFNSENRSSIKKSSFKNSDQKLESKTVKADLFDVKNIQGYNTRSSISSNSSQDSIPTEEKYKEAIREFTRASDNINSALDRDLDKLSRELSIEAGENNPAMVDTQAYKRVTIDLANDPDIKKYLDNSNSSIEENKNLSKEPELKLIHIDSDPEETPKIAEPDQKSNPFGMDNFDFNYIDSTKQFANLEPKPSLTWFDNQVNNPSDNIDTLQPMIKQSDTHQSIIDEFDPISSVSVSSKINHYNQIGQQKINNFTPKPFNIDAMSQKQPNFKHNFKPASSLFNNPPITQNQVGQSISHHSIQSLINPTPFYGGYNSSPLSFHSVPYPQTKLSDSNTNEASKSMTNGNINLLD